MDSGKQNWDASDYARHSEGQLKWALELIAKLGLRGVESVLDIGCGDGKITARLSQATSGRVVGIDQSDEMIRFASEHYPQAQFPNLSFLRMDAASISLTGEFEVAFSNAALHWVADHGAVLRGVRQCLKPGGRILFQMGGRGNASDVMEAMGIVMNAGRWRRYFEGFRSPYSFYSPDEYQYLLSSNGYRTLRAELIPKDMEHQGVEGLKGWLRTAWRPYPDNVPAEKRDGFLDAVIAAYGASHPVDARGRYHVRMARLEVEACRD
jgi:trans-aconitate methyltransferase